VAAQRTFEATGLRVVGNQLRVEVKNNSDAAATCYVRLRPVGFDMTAFVTVANVAPNQTRTADFAQPARWAAPANVGVEITLLEPPPGKSFVPLDSTTTPFTVAKPKK
jgi:hypothetical protein